MIAQYSIYKTWLEKISSDACWDWFTIQPEKKEENVKIMKYRTVYVYLRGAKVGDCLVYLRGAKVGDCLVYLSPSRGLSSVPEGSPSRGSPWTLGGTWWAPAASCAVWTQELSLSNKTIKYFNFKNSFSFTKKNCYCQLISQKYKISTWVGASSHAPD